MTLSKCTKYLGSTKESHISRFGLTGKVRVGLRGRSILDPPFRAQPSNIVPRLSSLLSPIPEQREGGGNDAGTVLPLSSFPIERWTGR